MDAALVTQSLRKLQQALSDPHRSLRLDNVHRLAILLQSIHHPEVVHYALVHEDSVMAHAILRIASEWIDLPPRVLELLSRRSPYALFSTLNHLVSRNEVERICHIATQHEGAFLLSLHQLVVWHRPDLVHHVRREALAKKLPGAVAVSCDRMLYGGLHSRREMDVAKKAERDMSRMVHEGTVTQGNAEQALHAVHTDSVALSVYRDKLFVELISKDTATNAQRPVHQQLLTVLLDEGETSAYHTMTMSRACKNPDLESLSNLVTRYPLLYGTFHTMVLEVAPILPPEKCLRCVVRTMRNQRNVLQALRTLDALVRGQSGSITVGTLTLLARCTAKPYSFEFLCGIMALCVSAQSMEDLKIAIHSTPSRISQNDLNSKTKDWLKGVVKLWVVAFRRHKKAESSSPTLAVEVMALETPISVLMRELGIIVP